MATLQEEVDTLRTDNHSLAEHLAVVTMQANKVRPLGLPAALIHPPPLHPTPPSPLHLTQQRSAACLSSAALRLRVCARGTCVLPHGVAACLTPLKPLLRTPCTTCPSCAPPQASSKLDDMLAVRKELDADVAQKESQLTALRAEFQAVEDEVRRLGVGREGGGNHTPTQPAPGRALFLPTHLLLVFPPARIPPLPPPTPVCPG